MSKHARDRRPYVRPVTRIELSESNIRLRWIAIVLLLSIAVVSITMGLAEMLKTEPGWQEVQVSSTRLNCSQDFVLMYDFGRSELDATAEYRNVVTLYTKLTEDAYQLFSADSTPESGGSVYTLNRNVNQPVRVPGELYQALALLAESDCRDPFLAPAVKKYDAVFLSANDGEAYLYDPSRNPELQSSLAELAAFASDSDMIRLELLGENQVQLTVSDAYLAYAKEAEIEVLFDFGWMKNAFIADYLAQGLGSGGYTSGYLASYDGFTRNLDGSGEVYSYNLFDRYGNTISIPAKLSYSGPMSIVTLRNYPLSDSDRWHYYAYEDGHITNIYLDLADGLPKSSTDNLTLYSEEDSCAELLMQAAPVFLAEELDYVAIGALEAAGSHCIWAEGTVLTYSQNGAEILLLKESGGEDYLLASLK